MTAILLILAQAASAFDIPGGGSVDGSTVTPTGLIATGCLMTGTTGHVFQAGMSCPGTSKVLIGATGTSNAVPQSTFNVVGGVVISTNATALPAIYINAGTFAQGLVAIGTDTSFAGETAFLQVMARPGSNGIVSLGAPGNVAGFNTTRTDQPGNATIIGRNNFRAVGKAGSVIPTLRMTSTACSDFSTENGCADFTIDNVSAGVITERLRVNATGQIQISAGSTMTATGGMSWSTSTIALLGDQAPMTLGVDGSLNLMSASIATGDPHLNVGAKGAGLGYAGGNLYLASAGNYGLIYSVASSYASFGGTNGFQPTFNTGLAATATRPSLYGAQDENTGLWLAGNDQAHIVAGGLSRIEVDLTSVTVKSNAGVSGDAILVSSQNAVAIWFISGAGHIVSSGTAPTASSCGTTPVVDGTDSNGKVIIGGTPDNSCLLTFAVPWSKAPTCIAQDETTNIVTGAVATATTVSLNGIALGGDVMNYICFGTRSP